MIIKGEKFTFVDTFETPITVADSWVVPKNKLGGGNGEAKLYVVHAKRWSLSLGRLVSQLLVMCSGRICRHI